MQASNRLTTEFIRRHPVMAAKTLEQVSVDDAVMFLEEIESELSSELFRYLMPDYAQRCVSVISDNLLFKYVELHPAALARTIRRLDKDNRQQIIERMPEHIRTGIRQQIAYPEMSVGSVMLTGCPLMRVDFTVEKAIERLKKQRSYQECPIFTVDDDHKLIGIVKAENLLSAEKHVYLNNIIDRKTPRVRATTQIDAMENHPGWNKYKQMPVIEKDGTFIGYIDYEVIHSYTKQYGNKNDQLDPFDGLLSLTGLYWLNVAWLLEMMFSGKSSKK